MSRSVNFFHRQFKKPIASLSRNHFQRACKRKTTFSVPNYPLFDYHEEQENENSTEFLPNNIFDGLTTRNFLKMFITTFNITHQAGDILLKFLSERYDEKLPKSSKTLLETPKVLDVKEIQRKGFYSHYGIEKNLVNFKNIPENVDTLNFQFFIDGLEVKTIQISIKILLTIFIIQGKYRSKKTVWLIMGRIMELDGRKPMVIGVFCGKLPFL